MHELTAVLAQEPFFAGMPEVQLDAIAPLVEEISLEAGEVFARQGDPADEFYIVRTGTVILEVGSKRGGNPLDVQLLGPGDVVGFSWIFPPHRWKFSARTTTPATLWRFDAVELRRDANVDPALGYEVMRRFAGVLGARLQATREQLLDLIESAG